MDKRKLLKFFVGGGVVGLVIVVVYWAVTGGVVVEQEGEPFPTSISFPTVTPAREEVVTPAIKLPPIRGGKLIIDGVETEDFLAETVEVYVGGSVLFAESKDYRLLYSSNSRQFLISIVGSPFESLRGEAEQEFLGKLGISREEACRLDVVVGTPRFANPDFAGREYRLSFCQ